jgi:SAM-dependent methyltransferase
MCGSGRFLVPLAEAGIDIDGVDASADMLDACRAKCADARVQPGVYEQFVHELDLPRTYALAFIAAGSFGLLIEEADYRASLRALHAHLDPGALLVLEAETLENVPPASGVWAGRWWTRADGALIVERRTSRYDRATNVEEGLNIYELFVGGRLLETELNDWTRRFWEPAVLEQEVRAAGFGKVSVRAGAGACSVHARR